MLRELELYASLNLYSSSKTRANPFLLIRWTRGGPSWIKQSFRREPIMRGGRGLSWGPTHRNIKLGFCEAHGYVRKIPVGDAEDVASRPDEALEGLLGRALDAPICLNAARFPHQHVWLYMNRLFWSADALGDDDVQALVDAKELSKRRTLERAKAKVASAAAVTPDDNMYVERRTGIADDAKIFVWQRDGGSCVNCGSRSELEFDHVIPLSMGGGNSARNLQILCGVCNREKGGNLV